MTWVLLDSAIAKFRSMMADSIERDLITARDALNATQRRWESARPERSVEVQPMPTDAARPTASPKQSERADVWGIGCGIAILAFIVRIIVASIMHDAPAPTPQQEYELESPYWHARQIRHDSDAGALYAHVREESGMTGRRRRSSGRSFAEPEPAAAAVAGLIVWSGSSRRSLSS